MHLKMDKYRWNVRGKICSIKELFKDMSHAFSYSFYSIRLYENFSFPSNNWCSCIIIHIFKNVYAEQWPNIQITAAW